MFDKLHPIAENVIGRVVDSAQRHAWLVIVVSLLAAAITANAVVNRLGINTNTEEMLSADLPWRIAYTAYKKDFPYYSDTIVIVVDGMTADIARDSAAALTHALRAEGDLIDEVFYPRDDAFLRRNQLLYLPEDELELLVDELSGAQPFLARLSAGQSSPVLFDLLSEAVTSGEQGSSLQPAMARITRAVDELNQGNQIPMSWQALLAGDTNRATQHREFVVVRPRLDYSEILPAAPAIATIERHVEELGINEASGARVRLTGSAALAHDEMKSVIEGSQRAGTLALLMVLACLLVGLRSFVLVIATLTTLIVGLIFTAGFAVAAVGTLNMISVAFAVLYVGLGVDFAIHICLRYREMLRNYDPDFAVNSATRHVGVSLILCALTTATGFFAFLPTAYRGVAELGLIAGAGMFISLVVSVSLLPALLHVLPSPASPRRIAVLPDRVASFPRRHARGMLGFATVAWILAALAIPGAEFDSDPVNLNNPDAASVKTYYALLADDENSPMTIAAVMPSHEAAMTAASELLELKAVKSVRSVDDFVPDAQEDKRYLVDDLGLVLGTDLESGDTPPADADRTIAAIDALIANLDEHRDTAGNARLMDVLRTLRVTLGTADDPQRDAVVAAIDDKLLGSFGGRLELLNDSLLAEPFTVDELPDNIRARWVTPSGAMRIEIYAAERLDAPHAMKGFVEAARTVLGDRITGTPVINIDGGDAVKAAFIQAFSYAFIVISALLWLILRSFKEVAIVMSPLMLAGLLTTAATVVFGLPFNFANIIALPLLLGIGVDSALHMLHRYKTALPENGNLLQTSTARAIFFSALTTTVSFGNLAGSAHAGTASMGVILTIGVVSTLICTLLVLPALLKQFGTANTL